MFAALASATIVRPDAAPLPPALEVAVRSACAGAWRVVEIVFAGEPLRARTSEASEARLAERVTTVLSMLGSSSPRRDALIELRAARRAGALDGGLEMTALLASCGRVGDAPAVSAGRRRVRTLAIEALPRALPTYPALSAALRESAIATLLVDAARAIYRNATRTERDLARWAAAPTGTTTREQALTACAELVGSPVLLDDLEKLIATELGETPTAEDAAVASRDRPVAENVAADLPSPVAHSPGPSQVEVAERTAEPSPTRVEAAAELAQLIEPPAETVTAVQAIAIDAVVRESKPQMSEPPRGESSEAGRSTELSNVSAAPAPATLGDPATKPEAALTDTKSAESAPTNSGERADASVSAPPPVERSSSDRAAVAPAEQKLSDRAPAQPVERRIADHAPAPVAPGGSLRWIVPVIAIIVIAIVAFFVTR